MDKISMEMSGTSDSALTLLPVCSRPPAAHSHFIAAAGACSQLLFCEWNSFTCRSPARMHPSTEAEVFATATRRPRAERGRAAPGLLLLVDELGAVSKSSPISAIGLNGSRNSDLSPADLDGRGGEDSFALNTAAWYIAVASCWDRARGTGIAHPLPSPTIRNWAEDCRVAWN